MTGVGNMAAAGQATLAQAAFRVLVIKVPAPTEATRIL